MLKIKRPGIMSTVQDFGRFGFQRFGIGQGGPMDELSFLWANKLLENHFNETVIEVGLGQAEFIFLLETQIAITGADLRAKINGNRVFPWRTYSLKENDNLSFSRPLNGQFAYVAIYKGFKVLKHLGSSSTVVRENLGGLNRDGVPLEKKDTLEYMPFSGGVERQVPFRFIPSFNKEQILNIIRGYQFDEFSKVSINTVLTSEFTVSDKSNRMGFRLRDAFINPPKLEMQSEGIVKGAIQIPPDGNPIVLLSDRQTLGGYPKIGCLCFDSISQLVQRKPGDKVRFKILDSNAAFERQKIIYKYFQIKKTPFL